MSKIIKSVNSTAVKSGEPFLSPQKEAAASRSSPKASASLSSQKTAVSLSPPKESAASLSSKNIGILIGGILFIGIGIVVIFIVKAFFNNNFVNKAGDALGDAGKLLATASNLGNMCVDNFWVCWGTGVGAFLILTIAPLFNSSPAVEAISIETGETENEVSKEIIDKSNEVIEKITKDGKLNESQIKLIESTVIEKFLQEKLIEVKEKIGTEDRVNASIQDGITNSKEREQKERQESDINDDEMREVDERINEHIKNIK